MAPTVEPHHRAQPTSRRLTPIPADTPARAPPPWKSWTDQRLRRASTPPDMITWKARSPPQLLRGLRLSGTGREHAAQSPHCHISGSTPSRQRAPQRGPSLDHRAIPVPLTGNVAAAAAALEGHLQQRRPRSPGGHIAAHRPVPDGAIFTMKNGEPSHERASMLLGSHGAGHDRHEPGRGITASVRCSRPHPAGAAAAPESRATDHVAAHVAVVGRAQQRPGASTAAGVPITSAFPPSGRRLPEPEAPTGRRLQAGADTALDPVGECADSLLPVAVAARVHPGRVVGRDREPLRDLLRVARLDVDQALVGRSPQ